MTISRPFTISHTGGDTLDMSFVLPAADVYFPDLTGATARLHVRDSAGGLLLDCTTANGLLTITPGDRKIDLLVSAASTSIAAGAYDFDLEITWPGGDPRRTIGPGILLLGKDFSHD